MSNSFEKLPKRPKQHKTESKAVKALRLHLDDNLFLEQSCSDDKDYGTDIIFEVMTPESATNIRIHTQVKGTEADLNKDCSLSISDIAVANVNYLFRQPHSLYIGYHVPSNQLFFKVVEELIRDLEHSNSEWHQQETITVRFRKQFTQQMQFAFYQQIIASTKTRDRDRLNLLYTPPEHLFEVLEKQVPSIEVPLDKEEALDYLFKLLNEGHDAIISKAHNQFSAVLDQENMFEFGLLYLAEINLAVCHQPHSKDVIRKAISVFESENTNPKIYLAEHYYNIGNAYLGLKDYPNARRYFITSLRRFGKKQTLKAECHKNLGACYLEMDRPKKAIQHFQKAIALSPFLAEANYALAMWYRNELNFLEALNHLDKVTISNNKHLKNTTLNGWRAEILFELGDFKAAFREINSLLLEAEKEKWIWPWCFQLTVKYRAYDAEYYQRAQMFWDKFIVYFPDKFEGHYYKIISLFCLKQFGIVNEQTFDSFRNLVEAYAEKFVEDTSFLWDRAGHWAQDNGDWNNALDCYVKACEKKLSEYGYCLAVSLINTHKYQDAIDILEDPELTHEIDGLYFNQLAFAKIQINDLEGAIQAYRKSIELQPDYHLAWFELAGCYYNAKQYPEARQSFEHAIKTFPNETNLVDRANTALRFMEVMGY